MDDLRSEWQQIETAPKDGQWVLLTGGTIDYAWCADTFPPCVCAQWDGGVWQFAWYESGYLGEYEDPTHWMSLPAPPSDA